MVAALLGYRPQVGVLFFICVYVHLIRGADMPVSLLGVVWC